MYLAVSLCVCNAVALISLPRMDKGRRADQEEEEDQQQEHLQVNAPEFTPGRRRRGRENSCLLIKEQSEPCARERRLFELLLFKRFMGLPVVASTS